MTDDGSRIPQADALRAAIERTVSSLGQRSPASAAQLPTELAPAAPTARVIDAVSDTLRRNSQRKVEGE